MVFETLEKRIILSGTIEAMTPLHIGAGAPPIKVGDIDMPIIKSPDGQPYIPGSSLKGKTRSEAERIARKQGLNPCRAPYVSEMCGTTKSGPEEFCVCCRIFGTASEKREGGSVASKVRFRDAYPLQRVDDFLVRPGVALDRETGTVAVGPFKIEAVPAGVKFGLEIISENLADDELKLLLAAIKSVEDSALGGSSTRGFGKIRMKFDKVYERSAKYYLGEEEEKVLEGEELERWLREKGGA